MAKTWRVVVVAMLLIVGAIGGVAAQGRGNGGGGGNAGGGPGTGEQCLLPDGTYGTAQVVLDPGHGGGDTGAVNSTFNLYEANVNLDIAYRAMGILQGSGYTVALTRYGDEALDNSQRGAIANACQASVFVEIHLNASSDTSVNFTQTFWGKKNKDLDFATTMNGAMRSLGTPNNGVGQFANGGLLHANMPSTLVETVFITNDGEAAMLSDGTGNRQQQIASAIADGIFAWI